MGRINHDMSQWQIQDFLLGGTPSHLGVPASNAGTFWQSICKKERIGSHGGGTCQWHSPWICQCELNHEF